MRPNGRNGHSPRHSGGAESVQPSARFGLLSEPLLSPEDVAALMGVKRSTIYELARTGRLPYVKIGRATRFLRTDLERWLDQQRGT